MGQETNEAKKGLFCGSLHRKKALEPQIVQAQNMCTYSNCKCVITQHLKQENLHGENGCIQKPEMKNNISSVVCLKFHQRQTSN